MAILSKNNEQVSSHQEVARLLEKLGVVYQHFNVKRESLEDIRVKQSLSEEESEKLLLAYDDVFTKLQNECGYQTRDIVCLSQETPGIDEALAKFDKMHTHDDEEVRFIIDGSGVFGFSFNGELMEVLVQPGDYLVVPAGTKHWFYLREDKNIKALRFFSSKEGWVPRYTGDDVMAKTQWKI